MSLGPILVSGLGNSVGGVLVEHGGYTLVVTIITALVKPIGYPIVDLIGMFHGLSLGNYFGKLKLSLV